jgi:hypothetical protein
LIIGFISKTKRIDPSLLTNNKQPSQHMKAIFSFKSKTLEASYEKRMAGFYNDHYFIVSFKLAIHCAKQSFDCVELYTDEAGYNLLIKDNQLEFDKVHIILDDLNDIPTDLWMAGKLYAYSLQTEPFIHLDYDLFLLKPISKTFLEMPILVQCEESLSVAHAYKWGIDWIRSNNINLPVEFDFSKNIPYKDQKAYNLGLVGGQAYWAVAEFGRKTLNLIRDNLDTIKSMTSSMQNGINITYEQYFFSQFMGYHRIPVISYMPDSLSWVDFNNDTFVHIASTLKGKQSLCMKMEEVYLSRISK